MTSTLYLALAALGLFVVLRMSARSVDVSVVETLAESVHGRAELVGPPASSVRVPWRWLAWLAGASLLLLARRLGGVPISHLEAVYGGVGALAAEMALRVRSEREKKRVLRRIEYHLPNAMERVVMAVGAGLDVVPALHEASRDCRDPVSESLREVVRLAEAGLPVADAMSSVSDTTTSHPLRHALVHIGLAYQQGGEIVKPLKELSDATQAHFQESVEEQIAKLPVQAVLPLVVTFTGLIVCFVTIPLIQVGAITKRVAHVATQAQ